MKSYIHKIYSRFTFDFATKEDLTDVKNALYDQVAGLFQIQNAMKGEPVLRPMRGWAISPDAMAWVLADLQGRDSPKVIEFGSGQSTVILAAALRHCGGRLISVEHDPEYSSIIQKQVAACGLSSNVEFIHSSLIAGTMTPSDTSYDLSVIPNCNVDIALIDGPPCFNGPLTRLTPLRWAAKRLAPKGAIFLDDSNRRSEQSCIEMLKHEFSELQVIPRAAEKGLTELRND